MNSNIINDELNRKYSSRKLEINRLELFRKIYTSRRMILKVCTIGVVVGIIIILGTPKEYVASTLVVHESARKHSSFGISALSDMTDDMSFSITSERDAINPSLYSAIVNSSPFLLRLFDIKVRGQKNSTAIPLTRYLKEYQRRPWWSTITAAPYRVLGWAISLFSEKPEAKKVGGKTEIDLFRLTREEAGMANAIASKINIEVDKKRRTITIFVTMQDPLVAATVADTVRAHLKEYVTAYRTNKARKILEYNQKLCEEAQTEYYATQDRYTRYADANRNLAMLTSRVELSRLQSEMNLAYSTYNQMKLQVQSAEARVEKVTPVYSVIQPVTVPLTPSKPNKVLILAGCILLSGAGSIGWVLFVKDFIREIKKKRKACR